MLHKKYVSQFEEIEPSEALENYFILAGFERNTKNISLKKLKELLNDNILIITARYKNNSYIPDRSFEEVQQCYLNGIFPILRVINENEYSFYLKSYDGAIFTFESNPSISIEEEDTLSITTSKFIYSQSSFEYIPNSFKTTKVELDYTKI